MKSMIYISLVLNIAVLIPVCGSIIAGADWVRVAYGDASGARGILLAVYLAILAASIFLVFRPRPEDVAVLLSIQILYKLITPLTVGSIENPVVVSNIFIALIHCVTVATIWHAGRAR